MGVTHTTAMLIGLEGKKKKGMQLFRNPLSEEHTHPAWKMPAMRSAKFSYESCHL